MFDFEGQRDRDFVEVLVLDVVDDLIGKHKHPLVRLLCFLELVRVCLPGSVLV